MAIRHLQKSDAGNYSVTVRNKYGEKTNHVRLSMKDPNEPEKQEFIRSLPIFNGRNKK